MSTKFVFDRVRKGREKILEEIFRVTRKQPYPDKNTTVLAGFIEAMFQVNQKKPRAVRGKKHPEFLGELKRRLERPIERPRAFGRPIIHPSVKVVPKLRPLPEPPSMHPKEVKPVASEKLLTPKPADIGKEETLLPPAPVMVPEAFSSRKYTITTFNTPVEVSVEEDEASNPLYKLNEPLIKSELLARTKEYIKEDFEKDFKVLDDAGYINKKIEKACKKEDVECNLEQIKSLIYYLKRDLLGFRRIDPIMYDNKVKEIYCEGLNKPVTVEFKELGKIKTNVVFTDTKDLNVLLARLAKATGNVLSEAKPILDAVFQGYRVQAILGMGGASSKLIIKKEMVA